MKWFALYLALMGMALTQDRTPDKDLPDSEKKIPAGHYCKRREVRILPSETHAHPCDCEYSCTIDAEGNVTSHESSTCMAWCEKNGRRCTCWPEGDPAHPCAVTGSNAVMDMDGNVIRSLR